MRVVFNVLTDTDAVVQAAVVRSIRLHSGWRSVRYAGARYQLFYGAINWIRLDHPIRRAEPDSSIWAMKSAKHLLDLVDNLKSPLTKRNLALAVTFARRAVEAEAVR